MELVDLENRAAYHPPTSDEVAQKHEAVRAQTKQLMFAFNDLLPEGREKALVMTKLEEAMMWANAAIARNQ